MQSETKTCQNCKKNFTIEPEDFEFYKKIKVPPPTWCPRCRLQQRLSFYNLTNLFKRPCDLCKKDSISMYPPGAPYTVYCPACWESDSWDPFTYGQEYDFSRPFFKQLDELWHKVPLLALSINPDSTPTSPYTNHVVGLKNCYLLFQAGMVEDSSYGFLIMYCKSMRDSSRLHSCERMYDSSNCYKVTNGVGHRNMVNYVLDSAFLQNSSNCQDCFASANLRHAKYVLFNKQYSKEDYIRERSKFDLGSYKTYLEVEKIAHKHWRKYPPNLSVDGHSIDSSGAFIFESKNCKECYEVVGVEDSKYIAVIGTGPVHACYDVTSYGDNISECYECMNTGVGANGIRFCCDAGISLQDAEYSKETWSASSHIFGSVSIKKGEYVILNKPYSREDYFALRAKIIEQMGALPYKDRSGKEYRYGEFFPLELSPFGYNISLAQSLFPAVRESAITQGFN